MKLHPLAVVAVLVGGSAGIVAGLGVSGAFNGSPTVTVTVPAIAGAVQHRYSQAWICEHGTRAIRAYPEGMEPREGFERDHLIPLSVGGNPTSPLNVWYEPWPQAHNSDRVEFRVYRQVCAGALSQRAGQKYVLAYKRKNG